MIHIIDNRDEKAGLEIYADGYGNWYAWNEENGKEIACKYNCQAKEIKDCPEAFDI